MCWLQFTYHHNHTKCIYPNILISIRWNREKNFPQSLHVDEKKIPSKFEIYRKQIVNNFISVPIWSIIHHVSIHPSTQSSSAAVAARSRSEVIQSWIVIVSVSSIVVMDLHILHGITIRLHGKYRSRCLDSEEEPIATWLATATVHLRTDNGELVYPTTKLRNFMNVKFISDQIFWWPHTYTATKHPSLLFTNE